VVRHRCHNKKCCNIAHLEAGTYSQNYQDSREVHALAAAKGRKTWIVNGISYQTCRDAVSKTGISMHSIIKYTVDGVFDNNAYLIGCIKGKRR
jgi:hypothetical protein